MNARKVLQMPNAFAIAALAMAFLLPHSGYALPNHRLTPGAFLHVTAAQVCRSGYAHGVRAPYNTAWRKIVADVRRSYGVRGGGFKLDHLIPLELGGNPTDRRNLWPQRTADAQVKDGFENTVHARVCAGSISLAAAQREFMTDWRTAK